MILEDLENSKDFSILETSDIWIANTVVLNDRTAHEADIINLRKDESFSGTMGILGDAVRSHNPN